MEPDAKIEFSFLADHRLEITNPFKATVNAILKSMDSSIVVPIREIPILMASNQHQLQQQQ